MTNLSWISNQAQEVHAIFNGLFYALVTLFIVLGIFLEYFKWPLGQTPAFTVLVGRALITVLLLSTYSEVTNTLADFTDSLANRLGNLNQIHLVLSSMGDHLGTLSWSWVSVRDTVTMVISFVSFFLLYFSVYVVEAFFLYMWTLLYVFSPVLIALYVLPATAGATKGLYRSLFEVSCWKIVWSVLATLLWSTALSDINQPGYDINFITAICFNLILAGSLLLTPMVVHSLAGAGLAGMAQTVGAVAVGATAISPGKVFSKLSQGVRKAQPTLSSLHEKAGDYMQNRSNAAGLERLHSTRPTAKGAEKSPSVDPTESKSHPQSNAKPTASNAKAAGKANTHTNTNGIKPKPPSTPNQKSTAPRTNTPPKTQSTPPAPSQPKER